MVSRGFSCGDDEVVARGAQARDGGELREPPVGAAAGEDGDKVDGFGDERTRYSRDRFLDQLLKAAESAECRAGVDRSDTARVTRAPGLQEVQRLGAAHLADRDAIRAKAER